MTVWQSDTVYCDIEEILLPGTHRPTPSVKAVCDKCGHETESYGRGEGSIKRCLAMMREGCPEGESNFYEEGQRIAAGKPDVRSQTYHNMTEAPPVPRILICTSMADAGLEGDVEATLKRMLKAPAEIEGASSINWNLLRSNEGGYEGAYRWIAQRYDIFCLVEHSETGGLSKGVFTIAERALEGGRGRLVLWRRGVICKVESVRETYNDWKKDYGEAVLSGGTAR